MRTLGLPGADACLGGGGAAGAAAAARRRRAEGARRRCRPPPAPLPSLAAAGGEDGAGRKVCSGAGRGGAPRLRPDPSAARAATATAGSGGGGGRRGALVSPPPARVCGVQSGDASGEADGAFAPPSVSRPRDRIFIGKPLPAHPLGSEEFRALLVLCSVISCTGVPPAQIQKRDALAAFFSPLFLISYLFIGINEKLRFEE